MSLRGASFCALLFLCAPASALELICGPATPDRHGHAAIVAAAAEGAQLEPAVSARVHPPHAAHVEIDATGRVQLTHFADGARLQLRIRTASSEVRGTCEDLPGSGALGIKEVPTQIFAAGRESQIQLTGRHAHAAVVTTNIGTARVRLTAASAFVAYTPPRRKTPDVAVIVARATVQQRTYVTRAVVPVVARVVLPGRSEPRSQVTVVVAEREFGPVRADREGRFEIRVLLPPGIRQAHSISVDGVGNRSELDLAIPVPAVHRCGPTEAPASAWLGDEAVITALITSEHGVVAADERVAMGCRGGVLVKADAAAGGLHRARVALVSSGDSRCDLETRLAGKLVSVAAISLTDGPPQRILLQQPEQRLWALRGGEGQRVIAQATVLDLAGRPLSQLTLRATVDDVVATLVGDGAHSSIKVGAPAHHRLQREVRVELIGRTAACAPHTLRVLPGPPARVSVVDGAGAVCPNAELVVAGVRGYGLTPLPAPSGSMAREVKVEAVGLKAQSIVVLHGALGSVALVQDSMHGIPMSLQATLQIAVAPAALSLKSARVPSGDLEVRVVDALGKSIADRDLMVWPADGCEQLSRQPDGTWVCGNPRGDVLTFTDVVTGTSVMIPLQRDLP